VARLDAGLDRAKAAGDLRAFNRAYADRRRMAPASFPPYETMLARYRAALAGSIAGTVAPGDILARVFDPHRQ
jgi:hypothetical protein